MRTKSIVWSVVTVLAALALVVGVGGWLLKDSSYNPVNTASVDEVEAGVPTIVSPSELEKFAADRGAQHPIYWAGERSGTKIELTRTNKGAVFVRYIPQSVGAGDGGQYLTVATYSAIDGYDALSKADKKIANVVNAKDGAIIGVFNDRPLSTYFSFRNAGFQTEVFSPNAGESKQLTDQGAVKIVGGGS